MTPFLAASIVGALAVVVSAGALRSRSFAAFVGVLLGIHLLVLAGLQARFAPLEPLAWYLQAAATLHFAFLLRARLRGTAYRALVSWPAQFWLAGTFLAFPWAIADALGAVPYGWWLPYLAAALGVGQSLRVRPELVELRVDGADRGDKVRRFSSGARRGPLHGAAPADAPRALRLVQITDPHLGPFMSEERLRGICRRAVDAEPDLVLLTGDFFTMEGSGTERSLPRALEPLRELPGRVFACRGNHDLEVPGLVAEGLRAVGARLLIDEAELVLTPCGPVQILGLDHVWRDRAARYAAVTARHPRPPGALRLALLHDPGGFDKLPAGEADLVLSGHTHGGHVGLLSLGLDWTTIGAFFGIPDHGFWSRGADRMYVHRANGHYGFPLRIGVPAEESVLRVLLDAR